MTQNALDAYAMANGYGKVTAKMSEAEKVALRYTFVQDQLSAATGDFIRTSDSWANQVRVLKLNFESLKATIGQGLINVLTPVLKVINQLLEKLMTLAASFKNFTDLLAGKKSKGSAGGVGALGSEAASANAGLNDAAGAADSLSDSTAWVGKSAKKAAKEMKALLGFDEINKLSDPETGSDDSGSGGSSAGHGGSGISFGESLADTVSGSTLMEDLHSEFADLIDAQDWTGIGKYLADKINSGLQFVFDAINWDKVGPKITHFVSAFTDTINSLISNLDWGLLGKTIGSGVNTVVNTLDLLITGIDWINIGKSFATGLNGILNSVDWGNLGKLIGDKLMILPSILYGLIVNLEWGKIGTALAQSLNGILGAIDLNMFAEGAGALVMGLVDFLRNTIATFDWSGLVESICGAINVLFSSIDFGEVASVLSDLVKKLFESIIAIITKIDWSQIGYAIWDFIANIDWLGLINDILELIAGAIIAAIDLVYGILGGAWDTIVDIFSPIVDWFAGKFNATVDAIKGIFAPVGNFFKGVWKGITSVFGNIKDWFKDKFSAAWEAVKNVFSSGGKIFDGIKDGILNGLKAVINALIKGINAVVAIPFNGINTALRFIKGVNILGYKPFDWISEINVPQIPMLAKGGYVQANTPQLAMIGDNRHQGEVVAPEDKLLEMAKMAAQMSGNGNAEVVPLLKQLIDIIRSLNGDTVLYLGDEEVARSNKRGTARLQRRYSTVEFT